MRFFFLLNSCVLWTNVCPTTPLSITTLEMLEDLFLRSGSWYTRLFFPLVVGLDGLFLLQGESWNRQPPLFAPNPSFSSLFSAGDELRVPLLYVEERDFSSGSMKRTPSPLQASRTRSNFFFSRSKIAALPLDEAQEPPVGGNGTTFA